MKPLHDCRASRDVQVSTGTSVEALLRRLSVIGCAVMSTRRIVAMVGVWLTVLGPLKPRVGAEEPNPLPGFVQKYCVACHGESEQSGERRFDQLPRAVDSYNDLAEYQDILDQLNLGQMPPEEEDQPTDQDRRRVVAWLTRAIEQYHSQRKQTRRELSLRRLNSREYLNTIGDLLSIDTSMFDPTQKFPRDQTSENLDNVASALVTSGFLLDQYLESAEQVIEKVLRLRRQPTVGSWQFSDGLRQQPEIDQVHRKTNGYSHLTLYDVVGADKHEGAYAPLHDFAEGVPHDGFYELSFKASALNREHPYDDEFLGTDRSELLRLGIVAGNQDVGPLHKPQPIEPLLAELDLQDGAATYSVRIWLDKGYTPRFTFRNGLMDARNLWGKLIRRYPDQFPDPDVSGIVARRFNAIKYGRLPQIHVDDIEIRGPFYESWPTPRHIALLGSDCESILKREAFDSTEDLQRRLARFAESAFRRPVGQPEIERLMEIVRLRQAAGRSQLSAFGDAAKAVLCSPSFLYLNYASSQADTSSQFHLASRLAYFLWSAPPDAVLLQEAQAGRLQSDEVVAAQADRMLQSPKSEALVHDFLASWLNLRSLGSMPPSRDQFRDYYHYDLATAMRRETELFMQHLIDENLPPRLFLDARFTFANKRLAALYGIPMKGPNDFRKVTLPDRRRGGLLGQASVLTVSANGVDTSPVVRGVWLLDNLLGTPPSPPPPDVEPLDPDTRGATSIRDQLAKHRQNPSCNDCHRKIDPLGFALENFDPIGAWRTKYENHVVIDAAGELPGNRAFRDVQGFKDHLLADKRLFHRALTSKLLAYALGRHVSLHDRPAIDEIVSKLEEPDFGMRDLIVAVATSRPMLDLSKE